MLSCLAPLFILTMTRGISEKICDDKILIYICSFFIVPTFFVILRILIAKKQNDRLEVRVTSLTQNKEYVFTYFFTVLLPLYGITLSNYRDVGAYVLALLLIIIILFRLNLYYTNVFFVIFKYNVYIVQPNNLIILSKKEIIPGTQIWPLRLSNSVFINI